MALNDSLREEFKLRGLINIKDYLPAQKVAEAVSYTRHQFEQEGLWKAGEWKLDYDVTKEQPSVSKSIKRKLKNQQFADLVAEAMPLIDDLLNEQAVYPSLDYPQPLITLPNALEWEVPFRSWHVDAVRLVNGGIPGVQVFTFLESVTLDCAPTVAVTGSHRLLNDQGTLRSKDVVEQLKQELYFNELLHKNTPDRNRFLEETRQVGTVDVQVVPMVGEPGDIYLMDLRVVHAPSDNASSIPRIMLTQRFFLESARAEVWD